jgi:restriction-modification enzyme MmeI-like protein
LEFPGSVNGPWARYLHDPDERGIGTVRYPRVVPKDEEKAEKLKERTLTHLYNQRPTWLDLAHKKLDEAVFAAYGWDPGISDEEILKRLLALNLERAGTEGSLTETTVGEED